MKKGRISSLISLIPNESFNFIYDTCCDHGLIGFSCLHLNFKELIFVDNNKSIIERIDLKDAYIPKRTISKKVSNVQKIRAKKKDLIIIAGVGGNLIMETILEHLKFSSLPKYYLLSAHRKHVEVRKFLMENGFKLIDEKIVFDKNIFYDHLLASKEVCGREEFLINKSEDQELRKSYYSRVLQHYAKKPSKELYNSLVKFISLNFPS